MRARVGYSFDRWLPFLTFGLAYGHIEATSTNPAMPSASKSRIGWAAGGGLEHAFAGNWSAKFEYFYTCLGRVDQGVPCTTNLLASNILLKQSVFRIGVNYKFTGPAW
ncbi:MAG: porin family protein [Xanthobacteraceae bacterium]|nr:porin family protein [Xanthobacteraceae bacterium]